MAQEKRPTVLAPAIRFSLVFLVLCGLVYPLVTTAVARLLFPRQSTGSLVRRNGVVVGSELLGQPFRDPRHFWSRIDVGLAGSNLGPLDPALKERVARERAGWRASNPGQPAPADLLTRSGSGVDPHIRPETARAQVPRIARFTGIPAPRLYALVEQQTEGRLLRLFGEPRVNVLRLNLALDGLR
jgi:K+-transporting ATPase ATPase C chain